MQRGRRGDEVVVIVICFCRHGKERLNRGIDAFAPKGEPPVGKGTVVSVDFRVFY